MTRQQKIRNPLLNSILMSTIPTLQPPLRNPRLHQQRMQIPQNLRRLSIFILQFFRRGCLCWEIRQSKLPTILFVSHTNSSFETDEVSGRGDFTSAARLFIASQSNLGNIFVMNRGFRSISICSSSASFGWRGNAAGVDLQVLRAQVRKLRVRSFIF